jgi:hypothetical protein
LGKSVDTVFDWLLFLYGVVSLLLTLYILPIWKDQFESVVITTTGDMLKGSLKDSVRSVKKKFFTIKKDYAHAQLQDQYKMKEQLQLWRSRIGAILLIFLGIGSFIFTPISLVLIVFWLRIFFFNARALFKFEKIFVLTTLIALLIITVIIPFVFELTPFYQGIQSHYYILEMFNLFGAIFASIVYFNKFMNATLKSYKLKKKDQEIKMLKEKEKELKKDIKTLKKTGEKDSSQSKKEEKGIFKKEKQKEPGKTSSSNKDNKKKSKEKAPEKNPDVKIDQKKKGKKE